MRRPDMPAVAVTIGADHAAAFGRGQGKADLAFHRCDH